MSELEKNYTRAKADFLDALQPDDFRNGSSFNQAEEIIDNLNKEVLRVVKNQQNFLENSTETSTENLTENSTENQLKNPREFIKKAATHLFRENSPAVAKAVDLANVYLKSKIENFGGF